VLEAALKVGHATRVVAALAGVERVGPVLEVLDQQEFSTAGTQLVSSRIVGLPDGSHRLVAGNPVFVVWGERA
jgi:precorrin-6Y C5,15-methyltransferase (decarboxylating)